MLPFAGTVSPEAEPLQSTTAPGSASPTVTPVTSLPFGFVTLIVPETTAFRATEPVCVTSTFQLAVPV